MLRAEDLIRVAELIKLGAETARAFSALTADGQFPQILDATGRIDAAANELVAIGQQLKSREPEAGP